MPFAVCLLPMTRAVREAFTPELRYPESKVVWVLRLTLVALFAVAVFLNLRPGGTAEWILATYPLWVVPISIAFAFVPTRRPRTLKLAEAMTLTALLLHASGHIVGWYHAFVWYDKMLHFVHPLVSAFVIFALWQAAGWGRDWKKADAGETWIVLFSMAVTIGVIWEIIEFVMDTFTGTKEQNGLVDTMLDLIFDVAGAAVGATIATAVMIYGKRHGLDEISEEPKRAAPRRAPRRAH